MSSGASESAAGIGRFAAWSGTAGLAGRTVEGMDPWEAAGWGLAGGAAAGLVQFAAAIVAAGHRWPFRREQIIPGLAVFAIALAVGALVAAATHDSLRGPWPALVMGLGAPATLRGLLAGVQVQERKDPAPPIAPLVVPARPAEAPDPPNTTRTEAGTEQ